MKKLKRMSALFLTLLLCLATVTPAFAQTLVLDTEGPEYSGDILMTENLQLEVPYFYPDGTAAGDANFQSAEYWEATGIPGATGVDAYQTGTETQEVSEIETLDLNDEPSPLENSLASEAESRAYKVGDTKDFTTKNYINHDNVQTPFTAKCVAVTDHCTLWLDTKNTENGGFLDEDTLVSFAAGIEAIYEKITTAFGDSNRIDVDGDGKVAFVFYPMTSISTGGCFSDSDLWTTTNTMDMVNINSRASKDGETFAQGLAMGIMTHEWQHLINYSQTGGYDFDEEGKTFNEFDIRSDFWLNETFSQSATGVCGVSGDVPSTQFKKYNDFITLYDNSITVPFAFSGLFIPRTGLESVGAYVNWYFFGRYLASQTAGYDGGGDAIYKTVLNTDREDVREKETGTVYNLGQCNNVTLVKALTDMGYMGSGEGAVVQDFDELLTNYNLASFFRLSSGAYTLGTQEELGNVDLNDLKRPKVNTIAESPPEPARRGHCHLHQN